MTTHLPSLSMLRSFVAVTWQRLQRGPLHKGWTWRMEVQTHARRSRVLRPTQLGNIPAERDRLYSLPQVPFTGISVRSEEIRLGGLRARWIAPDDPAPSCLILYLPGGGYTYGSYDHTRLAAWLAEAVRARTLLLEYSLAPEFPFPTALEDSLETYRWLLNQGYDANRIVFAGEGAGGGLALSTLLSLRYAHLPAPSLAVLLSPRVDLGARGGSLDSNALYDWNDPDCLAWWSNLYLHGADSRTPLASPLWADLAGLPPLYIQAGRAEILWDQILELARQSHNAGVTVQLDAWEGMNHTFQLAGNSLPQSRDALERIGRVVERRVLAHPMGSKSHPFKPPLSPTA